MFDWGTSYPVDVRIPGREPEISTPRYFAHVTDSKTWSCSSLFSQVFWSLTHDCTTWHFKGLNSMSHLVSHTDRMSRSFWSAEPRTGPHQVGHLHR